MKKKAHRKSSMTNNQSKIEKLIAELCPKGVEFKELSELTAWDKKFNGVEREKQKRVIVYPYIAASRFKELAQSIGNVRLLSTGNYLGWTTEELAGKNLCEGEIVAIPWGGRANVKYFKGKFVTADNRIATSLDKNVLSNRFLYYWMLFNNKLIESFYRGSGIKHPSMRKVLEMKIPLPPLAIQEEIVKILNSFTELEVELEAELEARNKQYEHYRSQLLTFKDGTEGERVRWVTLNELMDYEQPTKYIVKSTEYGDEHSTPVLTAGKSFILGYTNEVGGIYKASKESPVIIFDDFTTSNHWVDFDFKVKSSAMKMLRMKENIDVDFRYVYYAMQCIRYSPRDHARQWIGTYSQFKIPVPPLDEQKRVVSILDKFDSLVSDISIGLPAELSARRLQYEYYRGKLLMFE